MESTIDILGFDQCALVLRYVNEKEVKEKLLGLVTVQSTTGEGLLQTVLTLLQKNTLKVENRVADSFDGASNMHERACCEIKISSSQPHAQLVLCPCVIFIWHYPTQFNAYLKQFRFLDFYKKHKYS